MANMWAIALGAVSIFTKVGHFVSSDTAAFRRDQDDKSVKSALTALVGTVNSGGAGAKRFPVITSHDAVFK